MGEKRGKTQCANLRLKRSKNEQLRNFKTKRK